MVSAADDMKHIVNDEIKAELADHKAAVVASSHKTASRIRRALGKSGGLAVDSTSALGIDFSAGRKAGTRHPVQRKRFATVAARRGRIRILARRGKAKARKVVTAGAVPSALYGAPVTGVCDSLLLSLRRTAASAATPVAQGRSLDVTLALNQLEVTGHATAAPMVRYAQEVWQATSPWTTRAFDIRLLRQMWEDAKPGDVSSWRNAKGPLAAAALSGKRIGWDCSDPFIWITDQQVKHRDVVISPNGGHCDAHEQPKSPCAPNSFISNMLGDCPRIADECRHRRVSDPLACQVG